MDQVIDPFGKNSLLSMVHEKNRAIITALKKVATRNSVVLSASPEVLLGVCVDQVTLLVVSCDESGDARCLAWGHIGTILPVCPVPDNQGYVMINISELEKTYRERFHVEHAFTLTTLDETCELLTQEDIVFKVA